MKFIKKVSGDRCAILTDDYSNNLQRILDLFKEAQKDFPQLEPSDVKVVQYGGNRIKRIFGLEFDVPENAHVPTTYVGVSAFEPLI